MATPADLLVEGLDRVRGDVHRALDGLDPAHLTARPAPGANPVGWLVWHLTRVQDDHLAEAAGTPQVWTHQDWAARFGLDLPDGATGYAATDAQVDAVNAPAELLLGYHDAVHAQSTSWVRGLTGSDLDRVVDDAYDPPVTLATRLVSVLDDDLQHAGQAAYVRGLLEG